MNRKKRRLLILGCALCLALPGCAAETKEAGNQAGSQAENASGEETVIAGNGGSISIQGAGARENDGVLTIFQAGVYRLTGTIDDGRIEIDARENDEITLVMDDFAITSSDYAAIYERQCSLLTISLKEGTNNTVTDERAYSQEEESLEDPDAAIFCEDSLVLEGDGALAIYGNFQEGARSKDSLTIKSGVYTVEAKNDGFKGKDSVVIEGGEMNIKAEGEGIQADNDKEEGQGVVKISEGNIMIQAGKKGIAGESLVEISGGVIEIQSEDDGVHSNKDVAVSGGTMTLSAGDDAVHGDNQVRVSGGEINITKSNEGIEGLSVDITGGSIDIVSQDDGINAAGESQDSESGGRGADMFAVTEGAYIRIAGGTVNVNASGDGIDSNGDLMIEGGIVTVEGPENRGNGILDFNGRGTITGGTFIGTGNAGMLQLFSEDSSQNVMVKYYPKQQEGGTTAAIWDGDGNEILSLQPEKSYSVLIFSSPELQEGESYTVASGEETEEVTISGVLTQSGEGAGGMENGGPAGGGGRRPFGRGMEEGVNIDGETPPQPPEGGENMEEGERGERPFGRPGKEGKGRPQDPVPSEEGE